MVISIDDVKDRLESFNCTLTIPDEWPLGFIIDKVNNHIKNFCNVEEIPDGLREVAVDMVVGEILLGKKKIGVLDLDGVMVSEGVSQIRLGDTTVSFEETDSQSKQVDSLIGYLMKGYEADLVSFRCFKW